MKNYLKQYGKQPVSMFQAGGPAPMAPEEGAPAQAPAQGGGSVEEMILAAYESQDPNMAMEVINMIAEAMMGGQGGGEQPMPAAKKGMRMSSAPMFRKGGQLLRP